MTDFDTRDIRDFEQLKRELETEYLGKRGMTHLQLEFNSLKRKLGKSAQEFGRRVEKLARELYEAMEEGQGHSQEQQKAILDSIKMQALHNFQIGLHDDIKMIVRAQRYQTLQEAITGASAEEKNAGIQCHKCGETGHYGRDCRTSRHANRFSLPKANQPGGINTIECTYCKRTRHKREECWSLNGRPDTERSSRSKTDAPKKAPVNGLKVRKKKSRETSDESSSSSGSEEDERPRKNKARAAKEYQVSQITGKHNIHTLNLITLPIQEAKKGKTNFLLDSGAILTLIKVGNLKGDTMVREKRLTLTGVTGHKIHTLGKIKATVDLGNQKIRHTMYVVEDDFPIDYEGILGNDFLTKRKAVISHATKQVHIGRVTFKVRTYKKVDLPPRNRVDIVKSKEPIPIHRTLFDGADRI
ncbi:uncharacterized protein [Temnothorax nylanderi]|uniref:uncharacterized protein n=1 Tax=Temnothorax nylanderi TaxID=102681 RepID=UPI003A86F91F